MVNKDLFLVTLHISGIVSSYKCPCMSVDLLHVFLFSYMRCFISFSSVIGRTSVHHCYNR
jgi:hypothetical protein